MTDQVKKKVFVLAHINPAVSLGAFVGGQLSLIKFGLYSVVQFIGAIIGQII